MREEWRSAMTASGGQCVMTTGPTLMPELSAGNLDTRHLVNAHVILCAVFNVNLKPIYELVVKSIKG